MKPIRVVHVFGSIDRGGAESMVMNLYRNLDRKEVQFDFVANETEKEYAFESEIIDLGGRIFYVPKYKGTNYLSYRKAWKLLLEKHPEWRVIHGHHTSPAFIYLSVAKKRGLLTIAHSHSTGYANFKSFTKHILRYSLRYQADHLFACSREAAESMFGNYASSAHLINNAIDADEFAFDKDRRQLLREEMNLHDKFVVGHVGRMDRSKNQSFLLEIFKEIVEKYTKDAILLLVGDGRLKDTLEKKANDLNIAENVMFLGVRSDISDLLQAFDLFIFPSITEGLPVTLIEAQAAGVPCLISANITVEVEITNLVEFIPLDASPQYWAEKTLQYHQIYERKNTKHQIIDAGYDVTRNVEWLEDFYLSHYK